MNVVRILPLNNNMSFGNFYHRIRKELTPVCAIKDDKDITQNGKYIGALPLDWISKFKEGDIGENTHKVFSVFSEFARKASETPINYGALKRYDETGKYNTVCGKEEYLEPADIWVDKLAELQTKLQEIFDDDCRVQYLDKGTFGVVFKISIGNKDCVLKTYRSFSKDGYRSEKHGVTAETLNVVHLSSALKPSQCAQFYCGKIPADNCDDGFLLAGFEDEADYNDNVPDIEQIHSRLDANGLYWGKYTFGDINRENFVNGKCIDFGDIKYTFSTREAAKMAKMIFPVVKSGDIKKARALKEKYGETPEYKECIEHLEAFMKKDYSSPSRFAYYCMSKNITREMIDASRALGVDYSDIEKADFSLTRLPVHRMKLEELFS